MEPDVLCQKIGQWFNTHKDEEPFAFGEVHLLTGEPGADIWLIIGKIAKETPDRRAYEKQWENTLYDHPVTWIWQKLADGEADAWLRLIYENRLHDKKRQMLQALLELARLIENNGYEIEWEAETEGVWLTEIPIRRTTEKNTYEADRWQELLAELGVDAV
ncbi:MAG: hypothetical protein HQL87_01490 [Magnetococcales bacterium]|nr:hypothetical protein [Magnetococcales bacterium]